MKRIHVCQVILYLVILATVALALSGVNYKLIPWSHWPTVAGYTEERDSAWFDYSASLLRDEDMTINGTVTTTGRVVSAPAEYSGAVQVYDSLVLTVDTNYTSTDTLTAGHEEKVCMDCVLYEWSEATTLVQDNRGWDVDTVVLNDPPNCGWTIFNPRFCSGPSITDPPPSDTLFVYFKYGSCGSSVSNSFAAVWDSTALELTPVCDSEWRWAPTGGNCIDVHRKLMRVWRDDFGTSIGTIIDQTVGVCPSE